MGTTDKMVLTSHDVTIKGEYNKAVNFKIDLNDNGEDDVEFSSKIWGSLATGQNDLVTVKSLNDDFLIRGTYGVDSIFLKSTFDHYLVGNEVHKNIYNTYSCSQLDEGFIFFSFTNKVFKLLAFSEGDLIDKSDDYLSIEIELNASSFINPLPADNYTVNDTIVEERETQMYNCNLYPMGDIYYIGFKFKESEKLGWIKVKLYNGIYVEIIESAISKR